VALDPDVPIRLDETEHDEYGWFTFDDAYETIRWTDDREALERLEMKLRDHEVSRLGGEAVQ
jgi:hypothetical protein